MALGYQITNLPMTQDQTAGNIQDWLNVIGQARAQTQAIADQPVSAAQRKAEIKGANLQSTVMDQAAAAAAANPDLYTNQSTLSNQTTLGALARVPLQNQATTAALEANTSGAEAQTALAKNTIGAAPILGQVQKGLAEGTLANIPQQQKIAQIALGGQETQARNAAGIPLTPIAISNLPESEVNDKLQKATAGQVDATGSPMQVDWGKITMDQKIPLLSKMQQNQVVSQAVQQAGQGAQVVAQTQDIDRLNKTNELRSQLVSVGIPLQPKQTDESVDQYESRVSGAINQRYQQLAASANSGGNLTDPQGIPYAKVISIINPITHAVEMREIQIPPDARNTVSGLPQGVWNSLNMLGKEFNNQELPKRFYGEIAPKYNGIVRALKTAKETGNYNNFRSMEVMNSAAGIMRPGAVVRDSSIEQDLRGAGFSDTIARHWASAMGKGILSKEDLDNIESSVRDGYLGYKQQVEKAKTSVLNQAQLIANVPRKTLDQIMFTPEDDGGDVITGATPTNQNQEPRMNEEDVRQAIGAGQLKVGSLFMGPDGKKLRVTQAMIDAIGGTPSAVAAAP